ncbi:hypothetical protein, partial [Burkholderia vietnamiensis]|uniref:hypothetical protein n=1 Tax=Burkholderia vietnamiensis TaxID=60552 RepID=UPI001C6163AF
SSARSSIFMICIPNGRTSNPFTQNTYAFRNPRLFYLGAAILHNPAENYQTFTSNDRTITGAIGRK